MKEQRLGRSVIVLIVFYLIACGVGFIINFQKGDLQAVGMGVVALLTPWIVPLLFHLLGLRMTTGSLGAGSGLRVLRFADRQLLWRLWRSDV